MSTGFLPRTAVIGAVRIDVNRPGTGGQAHELRHGRAIGERKSGRRPCRPRHLPLNHASRRGFGAVERLLAQAFITRVNAARNLAISSRVPIETRT